MNDEWGMYLSGLWLTFSIVCYTFWMLTSDSSLCNFHIFITHYGEYRATQHVKLNILQHVNCVSGIASFSQENNIQSEMLYV